MNTPRLRSNRAYILTFLKQHKQAYACQVLAYVRRHTRSTCGSIRTLLSKMCGEGVLEQIGNRTQYQYRLASSVPASKVPKPGIMLVSVPTMVTRCLNEHKGHYLTSAVVSTWVRDRVRVTPGRVRATLTGLRRQRRVRGIKVNGQYVYAAAA